MSTTAVRYCLDTNVIIALMRGHRAALGRLSALSPEAVFVPEIVCAELFFGCLRARDPGAERARVEAVLGPLSRAAFGSEAAWHYAVVRRELETAGRMIGPNDLLIAATALALPAVMVTANLEEFSRVPGLVVESWFQAGTGGGFPGFDPFRAGLQQHQRELQG